jgi:hypothetical protein
MKTDKEITCRICGFITLSYKDMVEHLAQKQKYSEENCEKKVLEIKEKQGEEE